MRLRKRSKNAKVNTKLTSRPIAPLHLRHARSQSKLLDIGRLNDPRSNSLPVDKKAANLFSEEELLNITIFAASSYQDIDGVCFHRRVRNDIAKFPPILPINIFLNVRVQLRISVN